MTESMQAPAAILAPLLQSRSSYNGKPMRFHVVGCMPGSGAFTIYNAHMILYWKPPGALRAENG